MTSIKRLGGSDFRLHIDQDFQEY